MKLNCWEVIKCGCEPGGDKNDERGICPAATEKKAHGINNGTNGGRACWAIRNTFCKNEFEDCFTVKFFACLQCDFYSQVRLEEQTNFMQLKEIWEILEY